MPQMASPSAARRAQKNSWFSTSCLENGPKKQREAVTLGIIWLDCEAPPFFWSSPRKQKKVTKWDLHGRIGQPGPPFFTVSQARFGVTAAPSAPIRERGCAVASRTPLVAAARTIGNSCRERHDNKHPAGQLSASAIRRLREDRVLRARWRAARAIGGVRRADPAQIELDR